MNHTKQRGVSFMQDRKRRASPTLATSSPKHQATDPLANNTLERKKLRIKSRLSEKNTRTKFSHSLFKVIKGENEWYGKKRDTDVEAFVETIAQELMRFYESESHYPKTRDVKADNEVHDKFNLLSKDVIVFTPLSHLNNNETRKKIKSGEYKGLGKLLVLSLFLNEVDLKLDNIGIDKDNYIVNIDGNLKFASLLFPEQFPVIRSKITGEDLDSLPFVEDYDPSNWLDFIMWDDKHKSSITNYDSELADEDLIDLKSFRREVNQTILDILITPPELWETFVMSYKNEVDKLPVRTIAMDLINTLGDRQEQLREAALKSKKFIQYLHSEAADEDAKQFRKNARQFIPKGKNYLLESHIKRYPNAEESMCKRFEALQLTSLFEDASAFDSYSTPFFAEFAELPADYLELNVEEVTNSRDSNDRSLKR